MSDPILSFKAEPVGNIWRHDGPDRVPLLVDGDTQPDDILQECRDAAALTGRFDCNATDPKFKFKSVYLPGATGPSAIKEMEGSQESPDEAPSEPIINKSLNIAVGAFQLKLKRLIDAGAKPGPNDTWCKIEETQDDDLRTTLTIKVI